MSRTILLEHNSGLWEGQFIRLDGQGLEQTRFLTHLQVLEDGDQVVASLTDRSNGQTRSMRFGTLPPGMQVSPRGHWSLGPDPLTPWSWTIELCLVHERQRRRLIIRRSFESVQSVVVVREGRQSEAWLPLEEPLPCRIKTVSDGETWAVLDDMEIELKHRSCGLKWQPSADQRLVIRRRYGEDGALLPLEA